MPVVLSDTRWFHLPYFIDNFSRKFLAVIVDAKLSRIQFAGKLNRIAKMRDYPCFVISDCDTDIVMNAILRWQ